MMWRVHRVFIVGGYTADRDRPPGIVKDQVMPPVERKKRRRRVKRPPGARIVWPMWTGLRGKTLWDWLLLISALAVPVVVGFAGLWFTQQQEARQRDIEDQRSQDAAMQAYLDNMSTLLIDEQGTQLRKLDPDEEVLDLIQARTETVVAVLGTKRQVSIVRFLARAQLILKDSPVISLERVNLEGINLTEVNLSDTSFEAADLSDAQLSEANLKRANLSKAVLQEANLAGTQLNRADLAEAVLIGADFYAKEKVGEDINHITANLTRANLTKAALQEANLVRCILDKATLTKATLQGADLRSASLQDATLAKAALQHADLSSAEITANLGGAPLSVLKEMATNLTDANLSHAALQGADLSNAVLQNANLTNADLTDANLTDAYLSDADLSEARGWTKEQLIVARSFEGATMPDGQILRSDDNPDGPTFEEWYMSKGRE
jgi:uncharacterized protein YjbI with pentapeptide repeats